MPHPYFDVATYPWYRPEADRLHEVLTQIAREPGRIDMLYQRSGKNLPALAQGAPGLIWSDALRHLTQQGALRRFLEIIAEEYPGNETVQDAVAAVISAKAAPPIAAASFSGQRI